MFARGARVNRHTVVRRYPAVVACAVLAAALAGCTGSAEAAPEVEPSGAVAIVAGARANMPAPALDGQAARVRDMAVTQQSAYSVVVADGAPYVADAGELDVTGRTVAAQEEQRRENRQQLDEAVADARARTPESDLLTALDVAAESIVDARGHRSLVVLDSGLSTSGALVFTQPDMLDASPEEVADSLGDFGQLPDLTGMSVVFVGLGETAPPQAPLDRTTRARLASIWTAIATEAGAADVQIESAASVRDPAPEGLPPVTPVDVPPGYRCSDTMITLTGGPFLYWPDTPVLLDPAAAEAILRPVIDQVKNGQIEVVLFGMAADVGDIEGQKKLSNDQAQAIANLFLDLGVPVEQLAVEGRGSDFAGFRPDRDSAGSLLPAVAAANRFVTLNFASPVTCG